MSEPTLAQQSATVYEALCMLDASGPERAELRASKVSLSIIDTLYPVDFDSLCEGVKAHLSAHSIAYLIEEKDAIEHYLEASHEVIKKSGLALQGEYFGFLASQHRTTLALGLRTHIWQELAGLIPEPRALAARFVDLLLITLWLNSKRSTLPPYLQYNADSRMVWLSEHMLPRLLAAADA